MSALSPYAAEFVQGEAYNGKVNGNTKRRIDKLSDNLAKVKIGTTKSPRPKAGQAYDVSLESILIETALSRMPQATPAKPNASKKEPKLRKKKILRPSDANKKLSKLKKSVVNYREELNQATKLDKVFEDSPSGRETDETLCQLLPTELREVNPCDTSEILCEKTCSEELISNGSEAPIDKVPAEFPTVNHHLLSPNPVLNSRKQPLKRTPTMDRLKADLHGESLKEVEKLVIEMITALKAFQDRLYNKDEIKARMRQRMYYGLKESIRFMQSRKVKMIVMARDLEAGPGGLDELIESLLSKAKIYRIPVVVALSRNKLKKLSQKPSKVACIAITDPSGREEQFERILEIVKPLGLLENLDEADQQIEEEKQQQKAQQDLETWTSTTRRGRFEFAVEKLFSSKTEAEQSSPT